MIEFVIVTEGHTDSASTSFDIFVRCQDIAHQLDSGAMIGRSFASRKIERA